MRKYGKLYRIQRCKVSIPRGSSKATGHGQINRRKDFKKLHIIADLVNRAIVAQKLTEGRRHDWKEMIMEWLEKTKKFLREYHIRSIIEAMIWSFKRIVGSAVQEK